MGISEQNKSVRSPGSHIGTQTQVTGIKCLKTNLSSARLARKIKDKTSPAVPVFFVLVLLHTATANGFQMVTSGAQSKAINDWLIPSVEVSSE